MSTRPILAILHRRLTPHARGTEILWTRHYVRLENAIRRAVELAVLEGEPGDVIEFALASGAQLGTVKLHTAGELTARWENLGHVVKLIERNAT
jgi:hypothetical protein